MRTHPNLLKLLSAAVLLLLSSATPAGAHDAHDRDLAGIVESIGSDQWVIGGTTVTITQSTWIEAGIAVGDRVEADVWSADGTLQAVEIERDDDIDDRDDRDDYDDDDRDDDHDDDDDDDDDDRDDPEDDN